MDIAGGTRTKQREQGKILLGLAGGMLVIAGGMIGAYYVVGTRSVAIAATAPAEPATQTPSAGGAPIKGAKDVTALLDREVELKTAKGSTKLSWSALGVEADPDEARRTSGDFGALARTGSLPVRLNREHAIKALFELKAKTDQSPIDAYLDLEARKIFDDRPGRVLDVWGSLPKLAAAARSGAATVDLDLITVPAAVTKTGLGIEDISKVLGHYSTSFSVSDKDRNFNLKLAASKLNGVVLKPGDVMSFNGTVGERSQRMGYKIAHVITAGEMVDGLAGGTCQISTTLFGAAFFAGLDIPDTRNHSRPSTYTPLGFDATVVWPDTDLKIKNPYEFPVAIRYVVTNGEARVEILGKERPYDKVVFERKVIEESPYPTEERLDEEIVLGEQRIDQEGFPGFKLERFRKFYKNGKQVRNTQKWTVTYKPVTEYIRRGTSTDPNAKKAEQQELHGPKPPKGDTYQMTQ
ncbi:MAG: VanW family protein [Kofleriaceae bacterium]